MEVRELARRTPQSHAKRQREQAKKDKRRAKDEKKALRKAEKEGIDGEAVEALPEGQTVEEGHGAEEEPQSQQRGAAG
ncbi:MAG: hypothetical protein OEQ25_11525 [Gammaproteobacteria bacterium]|nr:hypothetical protein [Gammaproteobacteria bacterium]MDH3507756.1 hypothetical protein [Gammaproteobacteria bacterium]